MNAQQPYLTLNNGVQMPQFGLGLYMIPEGEVAYNSVMTALENGYRHFDCAHAYQNERSLGRAIGISNFDAKEVLFDSLLASAKVKPQIMQIECHPYAQRKHWQERCAAEGIMIESWFPLGGRDSKGEILRDAIINAIAKAHGKSAAQVIIRWHIQEGFSVVPGSSNPKHIKENIEALDFTLTDAEMQQIRALDKEKRYFNMPYEEQVRWFSGWNPED